MNKYWCLGSRVLGRSVFLVTVAIAMSGCPAYQHIPECREFPFLPLRLSVAIASEDKVTNWGLRRNRASLSLHDGAGIALYLYLAHRRFGPKNLYECHRLSQPEFDRWVEAIETMASQLEKRQGESREVIWVVDAQGQNEGLAAIEELDPDALAAARSFACLVLETFGEHGETLFREAGPLLASRLDLPATCGLSEDKQLP